MSTGDDNDALTDGIYERAFRGLFDLDPGVKLADHHQGPLTFELLDELINDIPRREAAQHDAHMEFILNQSRWQRVILPEFQRGRKSARLSRMIRDMKFGVPCPYEGAAYPYVVMDEAKLPRFTRLRKFLFTEVFNERWKNETRRRDHTPMQSVQRRSHLPSKHSNRSARREA